MSKKKRQEMQFAVCINNEDYEASLELGKLYRVISDEKAATIAPFYWPIKIPEMFRGDFPLLCEDNNYIVRQHTTGTPPITGGEKMTTIQQNTAHEKVTAKALGDAKGTLSLKNLTGKWNNCDRNTRGLVRLVLGTKGSSLTVQGFGACSPSPCDWGVVEGIAYGESVVATEAIAFSAQYDSGFKDTIVTGYLDNGTLIVETYNKFKDGSGRSNYYSRVYLCRS